MDDDLFFPNSLVNTKKTLILSISIIHLFFLFPIFLFKTKYNMKNKKHIYFLIVASTSTSTNQYIWK